LYKAAAARECEGEPGVPVDRIGISEGFDGGNCEFWCMTALQQEQPWGMQRKKATLCEPELHPSPNETLIFL
jgi:hypothetical protein